MEMNKETLESSGNGGTDTVLTTVIVQEGFSYCNL